MWFVGDDWAEDHHDVEVQDASGRKLVRARLPEGVAGIAGLHELIAGVVGADAEPDQVRLGIETDRGPWVAALIAAGYRVFAINPRQVARYRERHGTSGAKSDAGDAHTLADLVRTDAHQLRPVAGDSPLVEGIKVIARTHQSLIWDRHRQMLRLRASLREFFPAALEAFADLTAPDALELLAAARTLSGRPGCRGRKSPQRSSGPGAATSMPRPRRSRPRCVRHSWPSPRSWPARMRRPCAPPPR